MRKNVVFFLMALPQSLIRIVIADDHQIVSDGIALLLESVSRLQVVGRAGNGEALLQMLQTIPADLILLDLNMPRMDGFEAAKRVRQRFPGLKILGLSMLQEAAMIQQFLQAGANGFVQKHAGRDELLQAIDLVMAGQRYLSPELELLGQATSLPRQGQEQLLPRITRRERQILELIVAEHTTTEIAERLGISFGTVETHRKHLLIKLGARNTAGLVRIALEHGLV